MEFDKKSVDNISAQIVSEAESKVNDLVQELLNWELEGNDVEVLKSLGGMGGKVVLSIDPRDRTLHLGSGGFMSFVIPPKVEADAHE
jgi:hypothetical protein